MTASLFTRGRLIAMAAATVAATCLSIGIGFAIQPHMENALSALQTAHNELQAAEQNKSGHRVAAMRLIDQAMAEVRAGIAAGK